MYCQITHGPSPEQTPYDPDPGACTSFGYYFHDAPLQTADPARLAALDALGAAMIDQAPGADRNSRIPPVFTFLGQFIDHDITAGTDRDDTPLALTDPNLTPCDRATALRDKMNIRTGQLDLDSVYSQSMTVHTPDPADAAFQQKLDGFLRFPRDRAKLWIAFYAEHASGVDLPKDRAGDVLRLGRLMRGGHPRVTKSDLDGLSPALKKVFLNEDGQPNRQRAIIGDARNDENLIVAQVHLVFLRLHNVIAQHCDDAAVLSQGRDAVFDWAQRRVRWIYQWLVVNVYLPTICDADTLVAVMRDEGRFYRDWRTAQDCKDGHFPLPLEFSVAGFRFGHSSVRPAYDWNHVFGQGTPPDQMSPVASFKKLFAMTGNGNLDNTGDRLPSIWGADWPRLTEPPAKGQENRGARKIDTRLALPLSELPDGGMNAILAHLAKRNLRRDHMLNLPAAQDCIAGFQAIDPALRPLAAGELGDGEIAGILTQGDLTDRTPLWYYILREAEVRANGEHLGALGTHVVAQTLLGLVAADPDTYWHQPGSDRGRWHPQDIAIADFAPVTSVAAMLAVAGLYPTAP